MESPAGRRATAGLSLAVVIAATVLTLAAGGVFKSRCSSGDWGDGRQYRQLCYTDLVPLYGTEHLSGGLVVVGRRPALTRRAAAS